MKQAMKYLMMILAFTGLIFLVACGGAAEAEPEMVAVTIGGSDTFAFDPAAITVPAGAEVTVTFNNMGGLDHNFVVVDGDKEVLTVTEDDGIPGMSTGLTAGGQTTTFTFVAPAAGTYKYVCTVAGHAAGGMVGTMTVTQ